MAKRAVELEIKYCFIAFGHKYFLPYMHLTSTVLKLKPNTIQGEMRPMDAYQALL